MGHDHQRGRAGIELTKGAEQILAAHFSRSAVDGLVELVSSHEARPLEGTFEGFAGTHGGADERRHRPEASERLGVAGPRAKLLALLATPTTQRAIEI